MPSLQVDTKLLEKPVHMPEQLDAISALSVRTPMAALAALLLKARLPAVVRFVDPTVPRKVRPTAWVTCR